MGIALAADADSITMLVSRIEADTTAWPAAARRRMASLRTAAAHRHFSRGLRFTVRGADTEAVGEFTAASRLGAGTYIEDDALYELARAQRRAGAADEAAVTAGRLLAAFPHSIYSNSTTRALATRSPVGARQ